MTLTFVETGVFTSRWKRRLDDSALRALQLALLDNPLGGAPIPGCGVLRKLRFADRSRGKGTRGGIRVIYMHTGDASRIDFITVYGKDQKDDMNRRELHALCELARALRIQIRAEPSARTEM
jgi:hypothetical protein